MEQTAFELTPQQKGMLAALSSETGEPVTALLAEALEALQERKQRRLAAPAAPVPPVPATPKPIWEIFAEASEAIPDEALACVPTDLAAQVDHYAYGLPKR